MDYDGGQFNIPN